MSKFKIMVKPEILLDAIETVEAKDAADAMAAFAAVMSTDMNQYFKAVPEEKMEMEALETKNALQRGFHLEFYIDELENEFGVEDTEAARGIAEDAYALYCKGDGLTEYECLEQAYNARQQGKREQDGEVTQ